jgi:hypothetical protein
MLPFDIFIDIPQYFSTFPNANRNRNGRKITNDNLFGMSRLEKRENAKDAKNAKNAKDAKTAKKWTEAKKVKSKDKRE